MEDHAFDLLCLQDDEYYFGDLENVPVSIVVGAVSDSDDTPSDIAQHHSATTLKICSSSLYIVFPDRSKSISRIPFDHIIAIHTPVVDVDTDTDQNNTQRDDIIEIEASAIISIPSDYCNPYITTTAPVTCTLHLPPSTLPPQLPIITELWNVYKHKNASTHDYEATVTGERQLQEIISKFESSCVFRHEAFGEGGNEVTSVAASDNNSNTQSIQFRGCRVSLVCIEPGWIAVTSSSLLCFQPYHRCCSSGNEGPSSSSLPPSCCSDSTPSTFPLHSIVSLGHRKFKLNDVAIEVFFNDNTSVLLAFGSPTDRDQFESAIRSSPQATNLQPVPVLSHLTKDWKAGRISNFQYLSALNEAAGRSFNDLTQYPIFPWILQQYDSEELDIHNPATFRDLSKPIAALNPTRVKQGREMYEMLQQLRQRYDTSTQKYDPPWMHGSHYSNPAFVAFYLMRRRPLLMLRLQNGRYDAPDRLFTSISGAWNSVLRWTSDVKELIPEFYTSESVDVLLNSKGAQFGTKSDGMVVADVTLPPWAHNSPEQFLRMHAEALESPYVSANLHRWVDLIFGVKQRGKAAVAADNVFHFLTDDDTAKQYIEGEEDEVLKMAFEAQVREYGRTPKQLFTRKHPAKKNAGVGGGGTFVRRLLLSCACGASASAGAHRSSQNYNNNDEKKKTE